MGPEATLLMFAKILEQTPASKDQEHLRVIKDTKDGSDRKTIKKEVIAISNRLIQKGAKGIIAGCTEISIIINPKDLSVPIFDALTILSHAAIEEAGSQAL